MSSLDFLAIAPEIATAALTLVLLAVGLLIPREYPVDTLAEAASCQRMTNRLRNGTRKGMQTLTVFGLLGILGYTFYDFFTVQAQPVFQGMYFHDQFGDFFKILFLGAALLVVLFSEAYIQKLPAYRGEFYAVLAAATLGMMLLAGAADLITLYVGLELMTISFCILVCYLPNSGRSCEAGVKYLILGAASSAVFLYGISFIYGLTGSTRLDQAALSLGNNLSPSIILATVFLLAGFGFKISLVPFHMWAPDIYEGAPTPVTAYLAMASKAAAFAALIRVYLITLESQSFVQAGVALLLILAALTMIMGNLLAIPQTNVKRMMAFSSVAQAGYLLIGVIAESLAGVKGVLFYALIYIFANAGAFAVIAQVEQAQDSAGLKDYAGLARRSPLAAAVMSVSVLSMAGIPPLAGFVGKFYLFSAVMSTGYQWIAYVGFVMSMVSVYYYLSVVKVMYLGEGEGLPDIPVQGAAKFSMVFAMLATIFLGIYPTPLAQMAITAANSLLR